MKQVRFIIEPELLKVAKQVRFIEILKLFNIELMILNINIITKMSIIDPNTISSLSSSVINIAVSQMSDTEICGVISSIGYHTEVDTLIKCNQESLDKIYRVKREKVDDLIHKSDDEDTQRVMQCIQDFGTKENPTFDDYMSISREMSWMIGKLQEDNKRCESDIITLESTLQKFKENIFMYNDDLEEDSRKVCDKKIEQTEGLIRLRKKTLETNSQSIEGFEKIVKCVIDITNSTN